tara:strand:- start:1126 stop:1443 length:318 start_codon:yes stop_codon:yes gene_type:complete
MSNWKNEVIKDKDSKWSGGDLGLTPSYYIGSIFKYQASHIIEDFGLSYNIGSVCSYILRAGRKTSKAMSNIDKQIDDYTKAIAHIDMEIKRLERVKGYEAKDVIR